MILRAFVLSALTTGLFAGPVLPNDTWSDLRAEIYGDAVPAISQDIVKLNAPYRTMNDPRTTLGATVRAPAGEFITKVSLIIDDNPMPVSAVFEMAEPRAAFAFSGSMRINGPTPIRVVVETDRGGLYMQESFVKTSGTGACAAPPGTDPKIALQTLGRMKLALAEDIKAEDVLASLTKSTLPASKNPIGQMARLSIEHPSHSGMQMDQISLLFIPARYVETVEVETDGVPQFRMTGSISLSENPELSFTVPSGASAVDVKLIDTEGAAFEQSFPLVSG